jgi:hypothetical protein
MAPSSQARAAVTRTRPADRRPVTFKATFIDLYEAVLALPAAILLLIGGRSEVAVPAGRTAGAGLTR